MISPSFRRQGMARRLLSAAEDLARDAGKKSVGLHVTGNNLGALRLYEAEGYVEVSRQRSLIAAWFYESSGARDGRPCSRWRKTSKETRQESVGLHVTGNNLGALRLYEAEGYLEVARQRSLIAAWFMDIREWLYLKKQL